MINGGPLGAEIITGIAHSRNCPGGQFCEDHEHEHYANAKRHHVWQLNPGCVQTLLSVIAQIAGAM